MANRKGTITVQLGEDFLARVNTLAKALGQTAADMVRELLDDKIRKHQKLIDEIREREAQIQKEYDNPNEGNR